MRAINAEGYQQYENIRRNRSAKVIQRSWKSRTTPVSDSILNHFRSSAENHGAGYRLGRLSQSAVAQSKKPTIAPTNPLHEKILKLKSVVDTALLKHSSHSEDNSAPSSQYGPSKEDFAFGLTQLQQRIRSQALQRQTEEGHSGIAQFGDYRSLLLQRVRMEGLLAAYHDGHRPAALAQSERNQSLHRTRSLLDELQQLPSLDGAAAVLANDEKQTNQNDTLDSQATKWFYSDIKPWLGSASSTNGAVGAHVEMLDRLVEGRWDTFLLPISAPRLTAERLSTPYRDNDDDKEQAPGADRYVYSALPLNHQVALTSSQPLSPRQQRRLDQEQAEESLKWISYCLAHSESTVPASLKQLRDRVLQSALYPQLTDERMRLHHEQERRVSQQQAKAIAQRVLSEVRSGALQSARRANLDSMRQIQFNSVVTIQAAFRGCRARRQLRQLLSRVRVDRALEILIREITSIENSPQQQRGSSSTVGPPQAPTAAATRARELLMSGRLSAGTTGGSALPKQFLPIPPRQTANRSVFKTPISFDGEVNYNSNGPTTGSSNYDYSSASPSSFTGLQSSAASSHINYSEDHDQSYMMNNIRAEAKQQLLEPTPEHKRLFRHPQPVPPTLDLQQQQQSGSGAPPRRSVQFVSPRSVMSTPATGNNTTASSAGKSTPDTSDMLSPFLGLHGNPDEGEGFGYISTPSASQSLSRSLTETFGQVATSGADGK